MSHAKPPGCPYCGHPFAQSYNAVTLVYRCNGCLRDYTHKHFLDEAKRLAAVGKGLLSAADLPKTKGAKMNNPTMMDAETAAGLLGIDVYDLASNLRHAAADELEAVARRIRNDDDEPMDVGKARRLLRASQAALSAYDAVNEAREAVPAERNE